MKFYLIISFILLTFLTYSQNIISIGKETTTIYSEILNEDRKLDIYLPKNYEKSNKNYPVLYLLDSYYNFTHTVGTVEYLLLNELIPEMIIIGIKNTKRNRDLTPNSEELGKEQVERLGEQVELINL